MAPHPVQYQSPLWRGLVECGLDVTVLYLAQHGRGVSTDAEFGRTLEWDIDLLSGFRHRFVRDPLGRPIGSKLTGVNPDVVSEIRRGEFDAVLVNGYSLAGCVIATLTARVLGTPVYFRGETLSRQTRPIMEQLSSNPLRYPALSALMSLYTGVFAIGDDSRRFFLEHGIPEDRITVARYGVENASFRRPAPAEVATARAALGLDEGERLILFAGKLVERKRPTHVAAVAHALRRRGVACRAVFVGSGPLEGEVARRVSEQDVLVGFANQTEMPLLYAAGDVVLVPSSYETWGLVVNEALAAGTPVVSSLSVPSAVEIAERSDSRVVRVVPSLNPAEWAEACSQFLGRPREELAHQCSAVIADYDIPQAATAIANHIAQDLRT